MKIKFILVAFALCTSFLSLTSCDVEPIDSSISLPDPGDGDGDGDGNGNGNGSGGVSSGDYWPAALNNSWTFDRNGEEFEMKMISINSISGQTYYTFNPQTGTSVGGITADAVTRLRKSGGNYYMKIDDFTTAATGGMPSATTTGSETLILKDNVDIGETWTQTYIQSTTYDVPGIPAIEMNFTVDGEILDKNATVTVDGETYTDVIKSRYVQTYSIMGIPAGSTTTTYWFAKDIGPVKTETSGSGMTSVSELMSYTLN